MRFFIQGPIAIRVNPPHYNARSTCDQKRRTRKRQAMNTIVLSAQDLLEDSFRLGLKVLEDGAHAH